MARKTRQDTFGFSTGVNTREITRASRLVSNLTGMQPDATSVVVEGVMRVCKQMNVVCTQENQ